MNPVIFYYIPGLLLGAFYFSLNGNWVSIWALVGTILLIEMVFILLRRHFDLQRRIQFPAGTPVDIDIFSNIVRIGSKSFPFSSVEKVHDTGKSVDVWMKEANGV